ncbi:endonuclease/exonuclease/phosphatase family protein [Kribbella sp. NPDC056345]|uniref:endonuclease/exonuclease/phosphatase family protein n=1 Tax=Kribbella sp. NPDC056345 TaxID=3345789 RepID=UPI0035E2E5E0
MKIRAATFNLRNSSAPDGENAWPLRREAAVAAIELLEADVVGLQEVLPDQLDYLRFRFPKYEIVGAGRDDGMSAGEHSSVLVRPGDWRIERSETRWLSDDPGTPGSVGWDAHLTRVATLVWLRHRSGTTIGVLNTHYDHAGEVAQLQSSRLVAKWTTGDLPWIVMGDLNATPDSPPLKALTDAGLRYAVPADAGGSWHDFTGAEDDERIDHILISPAWTVTEAAVSHFRPGGRLPSDHWPVMATLSL